MLRKDSADFIEGIIMQATPEELNYLLRKVSGEIRGVPDGSGPKGRGMGPGGGRADGSGLTSGAVNQEEPTGVDRLMRILGAVTGGYMGAGLGGSLGVAAAHKLDPYNFGKMRDMGKLGGLAGLALGGYTGYKAGDTIGTSMSRAERR